MCSGKTKISISFYKNANGINSVMCPYSWSIGALQNNQFYWDLDNTSSIIFSQDNAQDGFKVGSLNQHGANTATITTNCRWNLVNYFDNYVISLSNNTLNSFAKGVINPKF